MRENWYIRGIQMHYQWKINGISTPPAATTGIFMAF
jgi:hypothetical protein